MRRLLILTAFAAFLAPSIGFADLILSFTGQTGSNLVTWEASGSYDIEGPIAADLGSNSARLPSLNGATWEWRTSGDRNIGDFLLDDPGDALDTMTTNVDSSAIAIELFLNGVALTTFNEFDPNGSDSAGADDWELDVAATTDYVAVDVGDTLTWTGSGVIALTSGGVDTNFEDVFVLGSFDQPGKSVSVIVQSVPEPSSLAMFSILGGTVLLRRKRIA